MLNIDILVTVNLSHLLYCSTCKLHKISLNSGAQIYTRVHTCSKMSLQYFVNCNNLRYG